MNQPLSLSTQWLYQQVFKPIVFKFDPEKVHLLMVWFGKHLGSWKITRKMTAWMWCYQSSSLVTKIDGIRFPNPVGLAAGFDYNAELTQILPSVGFGFHTVGTITLEAYEGNKGVRLGRFPRSKSLLVNKGLKNKGAPQIIKDLQKLRLSIPTGISIASTNKRFVSEADQINEIVTCFMTFEASPLKHAYYELNISCPNTHGGEPFTTPKRLERLISAIETVKISRPIYVKMPIDLSTTQTFALLKVLTATTIKGVIFGNLTKDKNNPSVDPQDRQLWKHRKGNLSGKPTWDRSNKYIALTRSRFGSRFTIIGTGGIFSPADAEEKMRLGADLVQLITGMIYQGPQLIGSINQSLDLSGSFKRRQRRFQK